MITLKISGHLLALSANDPPFKEIAKTIQAAYRRKKKLWKAIEGAQTLADLKQAQHFYAASPSVKLTYFLDEAKNSANKKTESFGHYDALSKATNLFAPIDEPVAVIGKRINPTKGPRPYCSFGIKHKVGQKIIAELVQQQFAPKPYQYNVSGKGIQKAVVEIKKLVAAGYNSVLRLDVKKFFDSFHHDALTTALPVDKGLLQHCAIGKHYDAEVVTQSTAQSFLSALEKYADLVSHAGIPLGSAASPIIASYFMSKLDVTLPEGAVCVNYVDDFLVLAKSDQLAAEAHKALQSALNDLSVGDFELLEKPSSSPSKIFHFLGHTFEFGAGGKLHVTVTQANFQKVSDFAAKEFFALEDSLNGGVALHNQAGYHALALTYSKHLYSWLATFSEVDNFVDLASEIEDWIASYCHLAQVPLDTVKKVKLSKHREALEYSLS
ncbi:MULTISPECIES: reverse transcriptase domain-containing protein [Asticcacaulis]|uniref:reverse transcriptase domain-containing protein n=1 Tax=Asticcacaulis TaxID=76890 RepID=UPI001AE913D2|nr:MULTISPECIES: reverse transcriptase domain-containing protein [Asticcacaulis]MBP2158988.1 hypothetical protein [Asticcacaulis solisilvae]MDR6800033.1 hypothetical protein [Asticcacaulis sp. BE141]